MKKEPKSHLLIVNMHLLVYVYNLMCPDRLTRRTAKSTVPIRLKCRGNVFININSKNFRNS